MAAIPVGQAVLQKVVEKLGGFDAAAERLGISAPLVRLYLAGRTPLPDNVLLRAVDIVLDEFEQGFPGGRSQPFNRQQS